MRYRWAAWGDVNAFCGLMLDNVAVLVLLVGILTNPDRPHHFSVQFVVTYMIPGTALGVLLGDLVYTWMAFRLARHSGREDVTAMPLGLDTPSTFAVCFLVLLPALDRGLELHGDHDTAMAFAWHVGALVLMAVGFGKTLVAPLGNAIRRWVPRAGLLGSLAAIALVLIAFLPLLSDVAAVPLVGFLALLVILATLVAHRQLPGRVPGALAAVALGVGVYVLCQALGEKFGWPLVPRESAGLHLEARGSPGLPAAMGQFAWWQEAAAFALATLPVILPFGLATVVGGLDCTESAAAVGDEYDTRAVILTEGLASVAAGLAGGVIQNTPYIGQPAYKAMGGRAAYTLATALFIGFLGFSGWFASVFDWLPRPALFPILIYVGLEITAQSFAATPRPHYPAVALAALPALAYMATIPLDAALGGRPPAESAVGMVQTLRSLANGFIVTSLLWAAALAALIDGRLLRAAAYLLCAGLCSLVGIMHSPFAVARIAWPEQVMADLPAGAQFLTPYHWAASYGLAAGLVLLLAAGSRPAGNDPGTESAAAAPPC